MTSPEPASGIDLVPVETRDHLKTFVDLPWSIYSDDPNWVPPLRLERLDHLNRRKNPFFTQAEARFWLAFRAGKAVGRISAQVDQAHLLEHRDSTGHFGFLEAVDDAEVVKRLVSAAADWLRSQGMTRMTGPFSLSINDESGLLIEGFNTPPSIMMGHARPYYGPRLEAAGLNKAKDLVCYHYEAAQPLPRAVESMIAKAKATEGLTVRPLSQERFAEDLKAIMAIFNDAWAGNWGFVPFSDADVRYLAKNLKPLIRPGYVAIAELDGEPAAMAITLPNLNEVIADLDGGLMPFGWVKLVWRLRVTGPRTVRLPLMGVRRCYQDSALGAALAFSVIDAVRRYHRDRGVISAELSWVLEDNTAVRRMIETLGAQVSKTYRIYEMDLA